jgi:hypothetical protein
MATERAAARYKLKQAKILLTHLRTLPQQIALDLRRASSCTNHELLLATYFFACLGAARSVFYILSISARPQFKQRESHWRNHVLDQVGRAFFHRMTTLRDGDVHYGEVAAEALGTMIPIEDGSLYNFYNVAHFGHETQVEHVNPDGGVVRASGLKGSTSLYIEVDGRRVEAAAACSRYIEQLRSLIAATEDESSAEAQA